MGRYPLKMTRSKHESTATIRLVNLVTKRDSVFMAFSSGMGPIPTPFWRENAVLAYPFWLRLCRVRQNGIARVGRHGRVVTKNADRHRIASQLRRVRVEG